MKAKPMPKHKTSISISDKTLKFLAREGRPGYWHAGAGVF